MMKTILVAVCCAVWITRAQAATWMADSQSSRIDFSGVQVGRAFNGRFERFTAKITFDPARPQIGSADVAVDMTSAVTGDQQRDRALAQPEWFDVKQFARAIFHAGSFVAEGGNAYKAQGKLTIRGQAVNATVPFTLSIDGSTAHARGHIDLLRSAFGIGQGPWASGQYVALEVGVDIDLVAHAVPDRAGIQ